ncbi:hypothetical protein MC378_14210 [Polaribacter sp. MSW13]|uniref:Uncharacterized protein n=1 Tax=Polaribacter marinus TaxID=2916838 RepID=A0A9X1VPD9_9FLAO|nr:hypothetical protein [Polaribacter marinus]MCI2230329.1 hypothetical protein [Polaribacter marinus]
MSNVTIVDVLIGNIKEDQMLLNVLEAKIEEAKVEKQTIVNRLKDYRRDVSVLLKYADDSKKKELEELGFSFSETERGLNTIASATYDIIVKAKDNQLTNAELYDAYVKSLKNKDDAVNYTEFNIKCRSLFNTQRLLRKKGTDPKSSRTDIISLNGRVLHKEPNPKK